METFICLGEGYVDEQQKKAENDSNFHDFYVLISTLECMLLTTLQLELLWD